MRRIWQAFLVIGFLPWVLASAIYGAALAVANGIAGLTYAVGASVTPPLLCALIAVVLFFLAVDALADRATLDATAKAFVVASAVGVGAIASLGVTGLLVSGRTWAWGFVIWSMLSFYLPVVTGAAGILSYRLNEKQPSPDQENPDQEAE